MILIKSCRGGAGRLLSLMALILTLLMATPSNAQEIVETVEVQGEMFSNELLHSKNMIIITREDLRNRMVKNTADLFSLAASVDIARRGPGDASFDITMRGSNFEQVLVLVDGIPFNNPQSGHFNTDFPFPVSHIERVEIIRGGSSTTYGGGAFAGVINIILTKHHNFAFSVSAGENNYTSAAFQGGLTSKLKKHSLSFSLERTNTKGFHEGRELEQWKISGSGIWRRGASQLKLFTGYLFKDFGAQGFYAPYPSLEKVRSIMGQLEWKQTFKNLNYSLSYSYNRHNDYFDLDRRRPSFFNNESITDTHYLDGTVNWTRGRIMGATGLRLKREDMNSTNMGVRGRSSGALFVNGSLRLDEKGKMGIDAGMRQNFNPGGNNVLTVYTGVYRQAGDSLLLKAGYSNSFRLPSFTELYYKSPSNLGDPGLKPEISHNFEGSLSYYTEHYRLDAGIFRRTQKNMLDWVKNVASEPWRAVNLDQHDIMGVEATQQGIFGDTLISLGLEHLFTLNEAKGIISKYGLRFPEFSIKAHVSKGFGRHFRGMVNYNYKKLHNTREKGHFLDLALASVWGSVEITLRFENILDSQPEEIPGVKTPGRWIYLGVSHEF